MPTSVVATPFVIEAEVHSDDHVIEVSFDAEAWFTSATDEEIIELAETGWGGDYAADDVAQSLEEFNLEIEQLFDYVFIRNHGGGNTRRDAIGFEVHIKEEDAIEWLKNNRASVYAATERMRG